MSTSHLAERWNQAHSFSLFLKVIRWSWCVGEITHQIHPSVQTVNSPDRGKAQVLSRQVFKIDHSSKHEVMNEILANMQPHNRIPQEKIWRRTCPGFPLLRSSNSQLETTPAQTKRSHRVQSVWCPMSDTSGARWPDRSFRKCSQSRAAAWTVDSKVCSMNWVESQFLSWQKVGAQARPPSWNLDLYSRHNDLLIVYESSYDIGSTMHQNFGHFS